MQLLLIIAGTALLVWFAIFYRVVRARTQKHQLQWLPIFAVGVVIGGSVFGRDFFAIEAGPIPITLDRMLLGALTVIVAFLLLTRRLPLPTLDATDFAFLALTAWLCYSTFSYDWAYRDNLPISRLLFFNLLPFVLYWVIRHSKVGPTELKLIYSVLIGFGLYLAITGIAEWRGWTWAVFPSYIMDPSTPEFLGRARGPFLNPVSNGIFMIVGFQLLLLQLFRARQLRLQVALAVLVPIFLAGIFATLTRSVWMTLILAIGFSLWLSLPPRKRGLLLSGAATVAVLGLLASNSELFSFKRDKNVSVHEMKKSAQLRPLFAVIATRMFRDQPITGCGFGQYTQAKYAYLADPTSQYPLRMTKPYMQHNVALAYLVELGLIGVALLTAVLCLFARSAARLLRSQDIALRSLGWTMAVFLICYVGNGMFHDISIAPQINWLLYCLGAFTTKMAIESHGLDSETSENATKVPIWQTGRHRHPVSNW